MYLLIDYREKDFIKKLSEITVVSNETISTVIINNCQVQFKITNLPIADFIITTNHELNNNNPNNTNNANNENNNENDENNNENGDNKKNRDSDFKVVIERKSINDLCSSITDGRFREQKTRLFDSIGDTSKICYFIEGSKSKARMSNTIINGAILNLIYKHKYTVVSTENKDDTFFTIVCLYKKWLNNEYELIDKSQLNTNQLNTNQLNTQVQNNEPMKLLKRSDKINSDKFIHQLCLVPGISVSIANVIYSYIKLNNNELDNNDLDNNDLNNNELNNNELNNNEVNVQKSITLKTLIDIYNKLSEEESELYFASVIVSEKNNRIRKVGPALSKKIYSYFCK
jgi:ERCC4-type nuclease